MRIAIICPIGDLNRFGYQRVSQICLKSWSELGDLFLIHSSRSDLPDGISQNINARYIRDDQTLMNTINGREYFDYRVVANNTNIGIEAARQIGCDCVITICVNWYVESGALELIRDKCRHMRESDHSHAFLYRRMQIKDQLFDSDLRSIAIINIGKVKESVVKVLVDRVEINGNSIISTRGEFEDSNDQSYIDTELELTDCEMREKMTDIRNYEDLLPKRRGVDFWYWVAYFETRKRNMNRSTDELGEIGKKILAVHPDNCFGDRLLEG